MPQATSMKEWAAPNVILPYPACSSISLADLLPRVFLLFHFFFFSPISLSSPFYSSPLSCIENAKLLASRTSADRDFQFCYHRMVVTVWETLTFVFNLAFISSTSCPLVLVLKKTTNSWSQLNLSFHLWCCRPLSCLLCPTTHFFSRFNHFSWRSYSTIRKFFFEPFPVYYILSYRWGESNTQCF